MLHDYFVWSYLQKACTQLELQQLEQRDGGRVARIAPLSDNIFQILPRDDTGAVQVLLRTLAGLEDFARVNAHQKRRDNRSLNFLQERERRDSGRRAIFRRGRPPGHAVHT